MQMNWTKVALIEIALEIPVDPPQTNYLSCDPSIVQTNQFKTYG